MTRRGFRSAAEAGRARANTDLDRRIVHVVDFVFTKPDGGSYHPPYLSRLIGRCSEELKLPLLTAHGLRHTSATHILASGVAPKVAAERVGHADGSALFS